jgi:hypothetical protein
MLKTAERAVRNTLLEREIQPTAFNLSVFLAGISYTLCQKLKFRRLRVLLIQ